MNHSGGQRILSTAQQQPVLAGLHLALGSGGQEGNEAAGSADAQAIVHGRWESLKYDVGLKKLV